MTASEAQQNRNRGPNGPLYDLLMSKLPEYTSLYGGHKRLAIYKLADELGVSFQAIYLLFPGGDRETAKPMSIKTARKLIACSENQARTTEGFEPLTLADLDPYLPA